MATAAPVPEVEAAPIEGVSVLTLTTHADERGDFTELLRSSWVDQDFKQWNFCRSKAGVLRGVHLHKQHHDILAVLDGSAFFGMRDVRRGSPSYGRTFTVTLTGSKLQVLRIPPGVAHGFCFSEDSTHVYAVSEYWNHADELGCRYDDPDLELRWPVANPLLSERDADLPSLAQLLPEVPTWTPRSDSILVSPAA